MVKVLKDDLSEYGFEKNIHNITCTKPIKINNIEWYLVVDKENCIRLVVSNDFMYTNLKFDDIDELLISDSEVCEKLIYDDYVDCLELILKMYIDGAIELC